MLDPHRYRPLFPVCENRIYLDHAGVSPCPAPVARAVCDWLTALSQRGLPSKPRWEDEIEEVRAKAARLIGARPDEISFVRSTSHGLCLVAEGLDWKPGDEVICAPGIEYPSNVYPWVRLADRGVVVREIPPEPGDVSPPAVEALLGDRTRVVAVSSAQFASGYATDLAALSALCQEREVHLVVDAIQTLGAFPLDVQATPVAAVAACSHKWLLGVLGAGICYIRSDLARTLRPPLVGWRSTRDPWAWDGTRFELPEDGTRFEEGTLPGQLIVGLGAALDLLLDIGVDAIAEHITGLLDRLEERLVALGCSVSPPGDRRAGIALVAPPAGVDPTALYERLDAAGFATALRRGRIRVAPHLYNTAAEMDQLADAISAAL